MKIIITSPFEPIVEVQSEQGVMDYLAKISTLSYSDLCIELSNVMAAKHNHMFPVGLNELEKQQQIVTDLTDKAVIISILKFGQSAVFGYDGGNIRSFNELVNNIDEKIAQEELEPENHGDKLLKELNKVVGNSYV